MVMMMMMMIMMMMMMIIIIIIIIIPKSVERSQGGKVTIQVEPTNTN